MRDWKLIDATVEPTGDGILYAQNVSLGIKGELGRRRGLTYVDSHGARLIAPNFYPGGGYVAMLLTSTGTIETVTL
jgi:hypothetical protein